MARKLRVTAECQDFLNDNQKIVAKIIESMIVTSGLTKSQFASHSGISFSTLTNIFRPAYSRVPSIDVLRKIANTDTVNSADVYYKLIDAAGYDRKKYPFELESDVSIFKNCSYNQCIELISSFYAGKYQKIIKEYMSNGTIIDFVLYFDDLPRIQYWCFDINLSISSGNFDSFLGRILLIGESPNYKYTYVTSNPSVVDSLKKYDLSNVETFISVLLINEEYGYKEDYLQTKLDISLAKDGLLPMTL